jgi:protein O-GlcNAc transferase
MDEMDINKAVESALEFFQTKNLSRAETVCLKILREDPANSEILYFLGVIYFQQGNFDSAIEYIEKALQKNQQIPDAFHIIGMAFQKKGLLDSAIEFYQKTIRLNPVYIEAYNNLGNAFKEKGQFDKAIINYQKALQINPNMAVTYRNLGVAFQEKGQLDKAIINYQKAVQLDPNYAATYYLLGYAFMQQNKLHEAVESYKLSLSINPYSSATLSNLGSALGHQGKLVEAEDCLRQAIQMEPNNLNAYETLLMMMHYNSRYDAQAVFSEHLKFAKQFEGPLLPAFLPHPNKRNPARILKICYVSPDFRRHPIASFIEPVIAAHNRTAVELFCYSDFSGHDEVKTRIEKHSDHWRDIAGIPDDKVAELMRKDGIDILVDLAGHTAHNRLLLFARKPAPVQVSWIGYPATTGLSSMDYKIVDKYTDPPGMTEQFYTEELIRMPESFLCYLPEKDSPEVSALPALASGHITFGSCNNFSKVSSEAIDLWTTILRSIPGSRLIMKAKSLSDDSVRDYVMDMFTTRGIPAGRIDLLSWEPSIKGHLDTYNRIDIGLDTFPYNGTTTTCEALWMGVPVITLSGVSHASRVGVSILSNIGLGALIAKTKEEYLAIVMNLAGDPKRLSELRESLRGMMIRSPLTNAKRFVLALENSYRSMWLKWCSKE